MACMSLVTYLPSPATQTLLMRISSMNSQKSSSAGNVQNAKWPVVKELWFLRLLVAAVLVALVMVLSRAARSVWLAER
jgi:hypothetical protein